jgi:hypothetical protein
MPFRPSSSSWPETTSRDPDGAKARKEFTVKPGETIELGDILIEEPGNPLKEKSYTDKLINVDSPNVLIFHWALRQRFTQPGTHSPLLDYTYAEDAPIDETVQ